MVGISLTEFKNQSFKVLFFDELNDEIATKIGNKIFLTITQGVTGTKKYSSALIPLTELNLVTFAFIVKEEDSLVSLSFTAKSDNQLRLYKCIPLLEKVSNDFFNQMKSENLTTEQLARNSDSFKLIQQTSSEFLSKKSEPADYQSPLRQLIHNLGNNVHVFYRALLLNHKTVLFAEKNSGILNYPWHDLIPHKELNIKAWPEDPKSENDFDIMIVESDRKKECDAECVILDLQTGQIEHGKPDKYLENFFNYLKTVDEADLALEINLEVNNIFKWVNEIIEICTSEKDKNIDEKIKEVIKFHTKTKFGDRLSLLGAIARKYNEYTAERITAYFLKDLGIFENNVKRIDSKKFLTKL